MTCAVVTPQKSQSDGFRTRSKKQSTHGTYNSKLSALMEHKYPEETRIQQIRRYCAIILLVIVRRTHLKKYSFHFLFVQSLLSYYAYFLRNVALSPFLFSHSTVSSLRLPSEVVNSLHKISFKQLVNDVVKSLPAVE